MDDPPRPYAVFYSGRVRDALEGLVAHARRRDMAADVFAAVKEIDYRLRLYPQFGEPLRDLELKPLCLWIGSVPPLTLWYILDEERREVTVTVPFAPLPWSGL